MMITNFALPPGQTVIKEINRGIDVPDDLSRIFQQKGGRVLPDKATCIKTINNYY